MTTLGHKKSACKRGHVNPPRSMHGACIPCRVDYSKERYQQNREYQIARAIEVAKQDPESRRDYGRATRRRVSVVEIRRVIAACNGRCEACERELTHAQMCVDHCHATGVVRGVLCRFCNALEGMLHKKKERVGMVIEYVRRKTAEIARVEKLAK